MGKFPKKIKVYIPMDQVLPEEGSNVPPGYVELKLPLTNRKDLVDRWDSYFDDIPGVSAALIDHGHHLLLIGSGVDQRVVAEVLLALINPDFKPELINLLEPVEN